MVPHVEDVARAGITVELGGAGKPSAAAVQEIVDFLGAETHHRTLLLREVGRGGGNGGFDEDAVDSKSDTYTDGKGAERP